MFVSSLIFFFVRRYNSDRNMGVQEEQMNEALHTLQSIGLFPSHPTGEESALYAPFTKLF